MRYHKGDRVFDSTTTKCGKVINVLRDEFDSRYDLLRIAFDGEDGAYGKAFDYEVSLISLAQDLERQRD